VTASTLLYILLGVLIALIVFLPVTSIRSRRKKFIRMPRLWVKPISSAQVAILRKYVPYYIALSDEQRVVFEGRVAHFMADKTFIARNMDQVSIEMKILISSSAVQMTFGLPTINLMHFQFILVYPDNYYSTLTKKYHKGEVNPRLKAIVLSWRAFLEGEQLAEGINLGLHEMAHALHLENGIRNAEFDFLDKEALANWDRLVDQEISLIKQGEASFFRAYGSVDTYEFFAVAIERFFETPHAFHQYHPSLYDTLSLMLNQDTRELFAA
jgi:Mlc titration factor MtfA (ptsG expression regulator)